MDPDDYLLARNGWLTQIIDFNDNGFCDVIDLMTIETLYGNCPE